MGSNFKVERDKMQVITICLPESLLKELEELCLERKLCRSEIIRELLKKEFKNEESRKNKER